MLSQHHKSAVRCDFRRFHQLLLISDLCKLAGASGRGFAAVRVYIKSHEGEPAHPDLFQRRIIFFFCCADLRLQLFQRIRVKCCFVRSQVAVLPTLTLCEAQKECFLPQRLSFPQRYSFRIMNST